MEIKNQYDVIIVGAGPAGSTTAEICAKNGLSVLVVEKRQEIGAPKRCAEGLSDNAIDQLGLKIPDNCLRHGISGAIAIAPNGKTAKVKFKGSTGNVLERKMFDKWLAERAANEGASIRVHTTATDLIMTGKKVVGVTIQTPEESKDVKSKVVVAADGAESLIARKAGFKSKNPVLVDSGHQYEMCNIDIEHPDLIALYFGDHIAPRGYCWLFPKSKTVANVGIGIKGNHDGKTAKQYLDEFIANMPGLAKGSLLEENAGSIPVGGITEKITGDGIILVGDAANQVNPIHGGGISESIKAGRLAGDIIADHVKKGTPLSDYAKQWYAQHGKRLEKVEKVREMFEKLDDEQLNDAIEILDGEDLYDLAHGKGIAKLAKMFTKFKVKGIVRKVGLKK